MYEVFYSTLLEQTTKGVCRQHTDNSNDYNDALNDRLAFPELFDLLFHKLFVSSHSLNIH